MSEGNGVTHTQDQTRPGHQVHGPEAPCDTVFVDAGGLDLSKPDAVARVNEALRDALHQVHPGAVRGQALMKVHIGEPKCVTRMRPEFAASTVRFLRDQGASGVVAGDTTVAYSGPRGCRTNPGRYVIPYLELARVNGWSEHGSAGLPFVVLDRPKTAVLGALEFDDQQQRIELDGINRFHDFYLAGGFAAADFVINHAHLTLHGLAGLAGCVKSIAMGCTSLKGKLRMHQSLLPHFDEDLCGACGQCVEHCPVGALTLADDAAHPAVDPERCIGCGECEAICAPHKRAITLQGKEITDWQRGEDTLPLRMADYALGLLSGRWENTIHVLHMYTVTERCDCLNVRQKPLLRRDLGFLVGKNPFAIDRLAGRMLAEALAHEGQDVDRSFVRASETSALYVQNTYGIDPNTPFQRISPS